MDIKYSDFQLVAILAVISICSLMLIIIMALSVGIDGVMMTTGMSAIVGIMAGVSTAFAFKRKIIAPATPDTINGWQK